jgi:hypothetical protein
MDASQLFDIWAPADSVWSRWVKPALFAAPGLSPTPPVPEVYESPRLQAWTDPATAFVIDMPGSRSVELGLVLAHVGYRPVPLFNAAHHPAALINVEPIRQRLISGVTELQAAGPIPAAAPPAFLIDSNRSSASAASAAPGKFDNRWVVFPQDFPSANFLLAHGVRRVVLLQEERLGDQPKPDLAHVLRRWQEAGIEIYLQDPAGDQAPRPLDVKLPSRFRSLFYRALTVAGLRRNSAGGFGSIIPQPSSSSGIG